MTSDYEIDDVLFDVNDYEYQQDRLDKRLNADSE